MEIVRYSEAEVDEPEEDWKRVGLAGSESFSFEWFQKPPGHTSPMHSHENEQVCVVLKGELILHTETESVTLEQYDSAYIEPNERHNMENPGSELAFGIDAFAPGRTMDFWDGHED